jgi:hypothetical protein
MDIHTLINETLLVETEDVFKPIAPEDIEARKAKQSKGYYVWIDRQFDGIVTSKDVALRYARGYVRDYENVRVYEAPLGILWVDSRTEGTLIFPSTEGSDVRT